MAKALLFCLGFLLAPLFIYEQTITPVLVWTQITDNAEFSPRDGAGAMVFQNNIWLLGGWHKDSVPATNSEVWSSADGQSWELINEEAEWSERHCFGLVEYAGKMWIIGGDGNTDVWNSADGMEWDLVTDNAPWGQRYKPYVLVFQDKMWLMGGFNYYSGPFTAYNDVWHTTDGLNWTLATEDAGWSPRGIMHGSVVFDDKMWIISGGLYSQFAPIGKETYYNDVWCSANGVDWECVLEDAPWAGRIHHNIAAFDGKLWLMAGHNKKVVPASESLRNDVWYSENGADWEELPYTPWAPTHAASVFIYDDALWLAAGYLKNDVWKLHYPDAEEPLAFEFDLNTSVFPNPASQYTHVTIHTHVPEAVSAEIYIYDGSGSLVQQQNAEVQNLHTETLDLGDLSGGIYFLKVVAGDQSSTSKFVVTGTL